MIVCLILHLEEERMFVGKIFVEGNKAEKVAKLVSTNHNKQQQHIFTLKRRRRRRKEFRLAKNPSGHSCRTFRPGFLWTVRFYLNPKRVWHGVPERTFPTVPNIPDFLARLFGGIWNSGETSNKAVMDMPRTEKMNGLCDVVGFWWNM